MGNMLLTSKELLALGEDPMTSTYNIDKQMERVLMTREQREAERAKEEAQKKADAEKAAAEDDFSSDYDNSDYGIPTRALKYYEKVYPTFIKFLKTGFKDFVLNSPRILNGLKTYSECDSDEAIIKAVSWGSGPKIKFVDHVGYMGDYDFIGKTITLHSQLARWVENGSSIEERKLAFFVITSVLVHEIVHYLDYLDGYRQPPEVEPGENFIRAVYTTGTDIGAHIGEPTYDGNCNLNKIKTAENARTVLEELNKTEEGKTLIPNLP